MTMRIVLALALLCFAIAPAQTPAPTFPGVDPALIDDLVAANRILAHEHILDGYGHVSVRDPRDPGHYLMSRSLAPALVTSADIMEYDLDSNPIDAHGRTSYKERYIHGEIYKAGPDDGDHSQPFADHRAVLREQDAAAADPAQRRLPRRRPAGVRHPRRRRRHHSAGRDAGARPGAGEDARQRRPGGMRGHGDTVVAENVRLATYMAIYAEIDARCLAVALALGGPVIYLDDGEVKATTANMRNHAYERPWQLWKRDATGE